MQQRQSFEALVGSAKPESYWLDASMDQGFAWRKRSERLEMRFKRALVRVSVHSWFQVTMTPVERGTRIEVTQRIGVGKGWWLSGPFAGLFFGVVGILSQFPWRAIVLMSVLLQLAALFFGCVVAFIVYDGDAMKMTAHLQRVLDAKELPNPALQRM